MWVPECASTSAVLAGMEDAATGTVTATHCQTAGRGQRGNSWEAEPGKNLTFSMLLRPRNIPAARQFELSMLVALETADTVRELLSVVPEPPSVAVKWPNDIYAGDRKIAGLLIENTLSGSAIERSIVGIGLNVNQKVFLSDAPNPVSAIHFTHSEIRLEPLLQQLCSRILDAVGSYSATADAAQALLSRYRSFLWRGTGTHKFLTPDGTEFMASVQSVGTDGVLTLSNGRGYRFKEIIFPV